MEPPQRISNYIDNLETRIASLERPAWKHLVNGEDCGEELNIVLTNGFQDNSKFINLRYHEEGFIKNRVFSNLYTPIYINDKRVKEIYLDYDCVYPFDPTNLLKYSALFHLDRDYRIDINGNHYYINGYAVCLVPFTHPLDLLDSMLGTFDERLYAQEFKRVAFITYTKEGHRFVKVIAKQDESQFDRDDALLQDHLYRGFNKKKLAVYLTYNSVPVIDNYKDASGWYGSSGGTAYVLTENINPLTSSNLYNGYYYYLNSVDPYGSTDSYRYYATPLMIEKGGRYDYGNASIDGEFLLAHESGRISTEGSGCFIALNENDEASAREEIFKEEDEETL